MLARLQTDSPPYTLAVSFTHSVTSCSLIQTPCSLSHLLTFSLLTISLNYSFTSCSRYFISSSQLSLLAGIREEERRVASKSAHALKGFRFEVEILFNRSEHIFVYREEFHSWKSKSEKRTRKRCHYVVVFYLQKENTREGVANVRFYLASVRYILSWGSEFPGHPPSPCGLRSAVYSGAAAPQLSMHEPEI